MATALVTGGSRGIGLAVARQLGLRGFSIELISSNSQHLETAATELKSSGVKVTAMHAVDFADLDAVRKFAADCHVRGIEWDLLVNNAGIKVQKAAPRSAQGHERHMAINHLAHFTLTNELLTLAKPRARVVHVSSIVARFAPADIFQARDTSARYAASKLANVLTSLELQRRLAAAGSTITSVAAHPGFTKADPYGTSLTRLAENLMAQSCERGALPIVSAAIADPLLPYLGPRWLELWGTPRAARIPPIASDENLLREVWLTSEQMTGTSFPLGN